MSDYMTVGQLREALERYDPDRLVCCNGRVFERVVSIEPGGVVMVISVPRMRVNTITCEVKKEQHMSLGSIWGGTTAESDDD